MLTHIEANKLREEESTIRDTIRFISGKRGKKAKEDMARLEARKKELDEILKDAPIMALSPTEIWDYIERWAKRLVTKAEGYRVKFQEYFATNPANAFSSWGQDLVIAERLAAHARNVLEVGNDEPDVNVRVENMITGLNDLAKHLQESIVRESWSGFMRSTNAMGNLVTLWQHEADAKLHDELLGKYVGIRVDDLAAHLQSWKELQKELAEQE